MLGRSEWNDGERAAAAQRATCVNAHDEPRAIALSVVIPAFNEAARIQDCLSEITAYFKQRGIAYEVLVVDDGSRDGTAILVERCRKDDQAVRLLRLARNMGKGYAVRAGVREARGALLLIADADGATPIRELERLEAAIKGAADLAIGSRFLASHDSRYRVKARWHRTVLGNLFNLVVQGLGLRGVTDTQCGFKLLRGAVALDLFSVARINGYGLDLEILYVAQRRGYRIAEVPVNWADQPGSKVRVFRDGFRMLLELLTVRRDYARGLYAPRNCPPTLRTFLNGA
jgi:dolichyl-phosphate beta-glucosyltransferase